MVSATEARHVALREGFLEKRRRTGGWKKKFFVLTATHLYYFDSATADTAQSALATVEILSVDTTATSIFIHLYRKKKEYRATKDEERMAWVQALSSVAAFKGDGSKNEVSLAAAKPVVVDRESEDDRESGAGGDHVSTSDLLMPSPPERDSTRPPLAPPSNDKFMDMTAPASTVNSTRSNSMKQWMEPGATVDLAKLVELMKRAFGKQTQTSKSFSSSDVIAFVRRQEGASHEQALDVGQQLIDAKWIVPLKSHIFEDDGSRFKFYGAVTQRQPKNHLNMRAQSIQEIMSMSTFDSTRYAEDFLRKHSSNKIEQHCSTLIIQKEKTIDALKDEISTNYTSFIRASAEIKTMENSVSQLKALVVDCKRSLHLLKSVSLNTTVSKIEAPPRSQRSAQKTRELAAHETRDSFIHELEVLLHDHTYDEFIRFVLEFKQNLQRNPNHASAAQKEKVDILIERFTGKLVEEFNMSMQTSERMHKKEDHLKFLIQLGEAKLAAEMCLQNYSVRIALQLRHVPSHGNALDYVINFSRTFFTSLLMCYEDYTVSFHGQSSAHFISLTVWISAQLERFAGQVLCHIFSSDPKHESSSSTQQPADGRSTSAVSVAEFKNVAKFVSSAVRYVFYGSRQLELAGLPTAHCLAPYLGKGVQDFVASYAASIRATIKEEVRRERWEMMTRTIRDAETKEDREIILTQSARSFYSMIQQFLRDIQRVLNPSCATSYLADVHEAVVEHADQLLIAYTTEILQYLENPKLSSAMRLKPIVGLLTNVAYVQDDCVTRCLAILQDIVPKTALQDRDLDNQNAALWRRLVVLGIQRAAQSLMEMTIRLLHLDLSESTLVDVEPTNDNVKPLFALQVLQELSNTSNKQLEGALVAYQGGASASSERGEAHVVLATVVLEAMVVEMAQDEKWWHHLRSSSPESPQIGFSGLNRFMVELRVLTESAQSSVVMTEMSELLCNKLRDMYLETHPDANKDAVEADEEWIDRYMALCTPPS